MPRGRPTTEQLLARVDSEVEVLRERFGGLPHSLELDHVLREIWLLETHHSTAIEGSSLSEQDVVAVVERDEARGSLAEALEVKAYADAASWVYETAPTAGPGIDLATVREVHRRVVGPVWTVFPPITGDSPGAFRTTGVTVGGGRRVRLSSPPAVHADMTKWAQASTRTTMDHAIGRIAERHAWFERIHPFTDGNGRVGRLLANWELVQAGYPPIVIRFQQRALYLRGLERADSGDATGLVELMARAVSESINRFILPRLAGDARLVPLRALAENSPYSSDYLRQLAIAGRLRAVRHGALWLSSHAALQEYMDGRSPRGRR
ncbi:MAG: Fic family protein [Acidimicrobiia bacterium]|nr:Fic family protein [Acidimicrobiia bacterium]